MARGGPRWGPRAALPAAHVAHRMDHVHEPMSPIPRPANQSHRTQPREHSMCVLELTSSKCHENVEWHPQLIHMRRRKLRDCSLPMISGKPAGLVASGCGCTGAAFTTAATTTMRGGGGGPSMSSTCGTLCIASMPTLPIRSSKEGSRARLQTVTRALYK